MPVDYTPKRSLTRTEVMEQTKQLVHQRGQIKARVTAIIKHLDAALTNPSLTSLAQIKALSRKIELHYSEYVSKHDEIVSQTPVGKTEEQDQKLDEFDMIHTDAIVKTNQLMEFFQAHAANARMEVSHVNPMVPQVIVQQQPLKAPIPSFDGSYEGWPKFKALFTDIIGRCGDSDATKLHYLNNALIKEAAGIISAKVINDNNYEQAWALLVERFENPRAIIDSHINGLLSMKTMPRENYRDLRNVVETCTRHVEGLKFMNQPIDGTSGLIITNLLTRCLDPGTRKQWEKTLKHGELPKLETTMTFLKNHCQVLERCETVNSTRSVNPSNKFIAPAKSVQPMKISHAATTADHSCEICFEQHSNYKCPSFLSMSAEQRQEKVKEANLCFNCLRKGHRLSSCPSDRTCMKCSRRHHTLLHLQVQIEEEPSNSREVTSTNSVPVAMENSVCSSAIQPAAKQVFLMTALVNVCSRNGQTCQVRALLDSGSQVNFLSESMVKKLNLPKYPANVPVVGVGGTRSHIRHQVAVRVSSRCNDFLADIHCLVTSRITGIIPTTGVQIDNWNIPSGIILADPAFNRPHEVDMLIGAELFFQILQKAQLQLAENLPTLYETQFGWVIAGTCENTEDYSNPVCVNIATVDTLEAAVKRFFVQEEFPDADPVSQEDEEIEEHFCQTHYRDEEGRFVVRLPFRETINQLSNSRPLALKRFLLLEKRLSRNVDLKKQYKAFIEEYKTLNHCREICEEADPPGKQTYYLPHHAIFKPSSSSTKLRVVFDATAKANGLSLNDVLKVGPTLQDDLFSIVLRFRRHIFAFTGDISKMYRQIRVDTSQTCYQRIFWRDNPEDTLQILELSTITYGTTSASFLAVRSIIELAMEERKNFPKAADIILNDCYMDDFLSGAATEEQAKQLREELEILMMRGGFPVKKWCSNSLGILEGVPEEDREKLVALENCRANQTIKTLGLLWDPKCDQFLFWKKPESLSEPRKVTKRYILSEIAKLFDPLGLVSPVIVLAKIVMQRLWASKLGWDELVTDDLIMQWNTFHSSLVHLNDIRIPRCVVTANINYVEFHGFADASASAYGACVYVRCVGENGTVTTRLLCSKSKVAPLQSITMPRLELCAALLLARLMSRVIQIMKQEVREVRLWSDSQIVLAWRNKQPDQLQVYVRNRIIEINKLTSSYRWDYVRSGQNPADIVSRGLSPEILRNADLWWHGPQFLRLLNYETEKIPVVPEEEIPELKPVVAASATVQPEFESVFNRFSCFLKLQRVLAQVVRFTRLTRLPLTNRKSANMLTVNDMERALAFIVRCLQQEQLHEEIISIRNGELPRRLASLHPFIDNKGLLRVGGRLQHSKLAFDAKHQLILPQKHYVTELLIRRLHEERLHDGPSGLLAAVRQRFWLTNARSVIRKITRGCVKCFKTMPRGIQPSMGNLPECRVNAANPFELTGVDYAGPIVVREGKYKPRLVKSYIAIFVCLVTKATHLELVSDLTTEAFIAALDRFISRRGPVRKLMSDNATNFVGASRELQRLFLMFRDENSKLKINNFMLVRQIDWKFIPPRSPNFGGLWEAAVKSVKTHLTRTLANAKLTFEEFSTVLSKIEAILNSRPLYTLSDDPNEPLPITPAHLLLGRPLEAIPKPSYLNVPVNRLSRWEYLNQLRDHYWKRWSREYLSSLQLRAKWTKKSSNIKLNTIVIIMEDNQPAQTWKIGRIVAVFPGEDNIIRVADVKTSNGVFRRPISKLAPLPIEDNEEEKPTV